MSSPSLSHTLEDYSKKNKVRGKGPLSLVLVITRHAKQRGLPLNPDQLLTPSKGQVLGLGKGNVQRILKEHGITRILAEEGGRTSRGNIERMRGYVEFLNRLQRQRIADLDLIEEWWVEQVRAFFSAKPLSLRLDASKALRTIIAQVLIQASRRQDESPGSTFLGTVLQHLVGAKLDLLLSSGVQHHGASVADQVSGREADFLVEDVAIHVTVAPNEAVVRKCQDNLSKNLRPVIVTLGRGVAVAEGLLEQADIADRVDVFEAEQLLAGNLYEIGKFAQTGRRNTADRLVEKYNDIVTQYETDPSLRIDIT